LLCLRVSARLIAVNLPEPSDEALAISRELTQRIRADIEHAGGWVRFDRYMQRVLYEPGLGYYSAGSAKFGCGGDFITSADLGEFLPRALANQFHELLAAVDKPVIMEIGAGNGELAARLLHALASLGYEDIRYWILETSGELRSRQQQLLRPFGARVRWLDRLPEAPIEGLIVANEVADALPVTRFVKRDNGVLPVGIRCSGESFCWAEGQPDRELTLAVDVLETKLDDELPNGYRSEICLLLRGWIESLAESLARGAVLLIDYGLVRREYYHPQRHDGTLICHYRQRAHDDPFFLPGLQDVSAWVDFSACADAGRGAGLQISGFTTQGLFLLESTARSTLATLTSHNARELSALKTLVLPGEMGERFKLLLMTKNVDGTGLPGRDLISRL